MADEKQIRWLVLLAVSCSSAAAAGILLGWLSKSAGWGFSALIMMVGPLVGLLVLFFRWPSFVERVTAGVIASAVGICLFTWGSYSPTWRAETAVADRELDDLCVRVTALQLCYQRKVMGVFDFDDVPEPIRHEARQRVVEMPEAEKLSLCDRIFGKRINNELGGKIETSAVLTGGAWILLSLTASTVPGMIGRWFSSS